MGWRDKLVPVGNAPPGQGWRSKLVPVESVRTSDAVPGLLDRAQAVGLTADDLTPEKLMLAMPAGQFDPNNLAAMQEGYIAGFEQNNADKAAQEQWFADRGVTERAKDAATFAASMPVRAITRGEYGIGDVANAVGATDVGQRMAQAEGDFAYANKTPLEYAQAAGELSLGIPALNQLGMPAETALRSVRANAVAPRFPRNMAEVRTARIADKAAMERLGVEPFGPALADEGMATVANQLSKVPLASHPLVSKIRTSVGQTRDAAEKVASGYGTATTDAQAGAVVQKGLERFRDARPQDIVETDFKRLPETPQSIAYLEGIAADRAANTSFKTKAGALYELAWRGLPEDMRAGRSKVILPRFTGGLSKTKEVLMEIAGRNKSLLNQERIAKGKKAAEVPEDASAVPPDIALPVRGGLLGQAIKDIMTTRNANRPLQAMRDLRSELRRLASGMGDTEKNTLKSADLDRIQSAITQDMVALLERNAVEYAKAGDEATAASIRGSIKRFRQSDNFYRVGQQRIEKLDKLIDAKNPEAVGASLFKAATAKGKGDIEKLRAVQRTLKPEEWNDYVAGVIRHMGQPVASARGMAREQGFSVSSFLTAFQRMEPEARHVLFRSRASAELAQALDDLATTAGRMAEFEATANTSRSATNAIAMAAAAGGAQQLIANWEAALLSIGGTYAVSKFLASPLYVRWLTRAVRIQGDPALKGGAAWRSHVQQLAAMAEGDPEIGMVILKALGADSANRPTAAATGSGG